MAHCAPPGSVANVALDWALSDDPRYRMAQLLRQAIDSGVPPSLARIPMTPEPRPASLPCQRWIAR